MLTAVPHNGCHPPPCEQTTRFLPSPSALGPLTTGVCIDVCSARRATATITTTPDLMNQRRLTGQAGGDQGKVPKALASQGSQPKSEIRFAPSWIQEPQITSHREQTDENGSFWGNSRKKMERETIEEEETARVRRLFFFSPCIHPLLMHLAYLLSVYMYCRSRYLRANDHVASQGPRIYFVSRPRLAADRAVVP